MFNDVQRDLIGFLAAIPLAIVVLSLTVATFGYVV